MAARIALAGIDQLSRIEPLTRALHDHHRTVDPAIPGVPLRDTDAWWSVRRDRYRAWLAEPDTFLVIADDARNEDARRLYEREGFRPWVLLTLGKVPDPDLPVS